MKEIKIQAMTYPQNCEIKTDGSPIDRNYLTSIEIILSEVKITNEESYGIGGKSTAPYIMYEYYPSVIYELYGVKQQHTLNENLNQSGNLLLEHHIYKLIDFLTKLVEYEDLKIKLPEKEKTKQFKI